MYTDNAVITTRTTRSLSPSDTLSHTDPVEHVVEIPWHSYDLS